MIPIRTSIRDFSKEFQAWRLNETLFPRISFEDVKGLKAGDFERILSNANNGLLEIVDEKTSARVYVDPKEKDVFVYFGGDKKSFGIEWLRVSQVAREIAKYEPEIALRIDERLSELRDPSCVYNLHDEIDRWARSVVDSELRFGLTEKSIPLGDHYLFSKLFGSLCLLNEAYSEIFRSLEEEGYEIEFDERRVSIGKGDTWIEVYDLHPFSLIYSNDPSEAMKALGRVREVVLEEKSIAEKKVWGYLDDLLISLDFLENSLERGKYTDRIPRFSKPIIVGGEGYLVKMSDKDMKRFVSMLADQIKFVYDKSKEIGDVGLFKGFWEDVKDLYPKISSETFEVVKEEGLGEELKKYSKPSIKKVLGAAMLIGALAGSAYVLSKSRSTTTKKRPTTTPPLNVTPTTTPLATEVLKVTGNLTQAVEFLNLVNNTNISADKALGFVKNYPFLVKSNNYKEPLLFYSQNSTTFDLICNKIQQDPILSKNLSNSIYLASKVFRGLNATNDPYLYNLTKLIINDGKISSAEQQGLNYSKLVQKIIPEEVRVYYTQEEIDQIRFNLVKSLLADENITQDEIQALKYLNSTQWKNRWWIKKDIINSGMINHKYLSEDWDKDGLSNIKEIKQGTNPLNDLETNPNNLSERYAIIVSSIGYVNNDVEIKQLKEICNLLVKNGYNDKNVYLILDPGAGQVGMVKDLPIKPDYEVKYVGGRRAQGYYEAMKDHFLNYIKNLPSDNNDIVFIYCSCHGNKDVILIGRVVGVKEFNEALKQMKYGEAIVTLNSCEAGGFLGQLDKAPNLLLIGTLSANEGGDCPITPFLKYLSQGLNVKDAFDRFAYQEKLEYSHHPVLYTTGKVESFVNPLVYIKQ